MTASAPAPADRAGRVWAPRLLSDLDEASRSALSYMVVDEVFGGMVGLSVIWNGVAASSWTRLPLRLS